MTKKKQVRRGEKDRTTTRREFFQTAGRGTLVLGGIALVGTGGASYGCGDDDDSSGSSGNPYGAAGTTSGGGCTDTCGTAFDGECDDGGPGSVYSVCDLGTDCSDCGPR